MGRKRCSFLSCPSKRDPGGITFHEIPSEPEARAKWLKVIARSDPTDPNKEWIPGTTAAVCSIHFRESDYKPDSKVKRLLKTAVPSVKSPCPKKVRKAKVRKAASTDMPKDPLALEDEDYQGENFKSGISNEFMLLNSCPAVPVYQVPTAKIQFTLPETTTQVEKLNLAGTSTDGGMQGGSRKRKMLSGEKPPRRRKVTPNQTSNHNVGCQDGDYSVGGSMAAATRQIGDAMRKAFNKVKVCQVSLLSHCVFCLRKTTDKKEAVGPSDDNLDSEMLKLVPIAPSYLSSGMLGTFNRIWPYLQKTTDEDTVDLLGLIEENCSKVKTPTKPAFPHLPKICEFCDEKLRAIDRLVKELGEEFTRLGKVVRESKYGGAYQWRAENFEQNLNSSWMDPESVKATIKMLGGLGKGNGHPAMNDEAIKEGEWDYHLEPLNSPEGNPDNFIGKESRHDSNSDYIKLEVEESPVFSADPAHAFEDDSEHPDTQMVKIEETINQFHPSSPSSADGNGSRNTPIKTSDNPQEERITPTSQKCDLCNVQVPTSQILEHVREHVGDDYTLKCPNQECASVYTQPFNNFLHLNSSKSCGDFVPDLKQFKDSILTCQVCGYVATEMAALQGHLLQQHENGSKNFPCPVNGCGLSFTVKQSVTCHLPCHEFAGTNPLPTQHYDQFSGEIKLEEVVEHLKDEHLIHQ